ncbi:hypothetical protein I4U23_015179 [Adineta vaga]|nr:hypothetical protein I4U23_015179 [Adineta vaga]
MTNTTLIWLNRVQVERIFQIFCFNKSECDKNTINRTYIDVRNLEYAELWAHLVTRLYDSRSEPNKLTCTNDQDASVSCSEGFCQLISNDLLTFSRTCVPKGTMSNPYGIILESKTIPGKDIESSIMYTCNRPMCNSLTMANEILHLLQIRELLSPIIVTTTTSTTTTESSSADMKKQLFYIPLIFVLIIMTIFA